jgi:putative MATE family efflux protein
MRALGETKIPMYASIVAIVTNAFFNYIFIFGHLGFQPMGVIGAAYGTLIARFVEMVLLLVILKVKPFMFSTKLKDIFHISRKLVKIMIIKAIPLTTNEILWSSGMSALFMFYATRGKEVMAGMSISGSMGDLFFTLFSGMAVATTVLISQPLGANKLEEAKENAYNLVRLSSMLAILMGILLFLTTMFVPQLFNVSEYSRQTAVNYSRIQALMFWIYMLSAQAFFILRAGGDTRSTMIMDSVFMWCVNIPVVAFTAYFTKLDVIGMFLAGNATDLVKVFIAYHYLRKEKWLKNLTHSHEESVPLEL